MHGTFRDLVKGDFLLQHEIVPTPLIESIAKLKCVTWQHADYYDIFFSVSIHVSECKEFYADMAGCFSGCQRA